jgi:hypothetical protein
MSTINLGEAIGRYKKRLSLIKEGKLERHFGYDYYDSFDDAQKLFGTKKETIQAILNSYPEGIIPLEEIKYSPNTVSWSPEKKSSPVKKSPSPSKWSPSKFNFSPKNSPKKSPISDGQLLIRYKKRLQLVKDGKIPSEWAYDTDTFESVKNLYGSKQEAMKVLRDTYGEYILENGRMKSFSPSPKSNRSPSMVSWSPRRNSPSPSNWSPSKFNFSPAKKSPPRKEGTKEERRKAYEKRLQNIAAEAARNVNVKNLKGMGNANIIEKYGKTRGEALIAKKKAAVPELTKEERRKAYEKKLQNIAAEAVRTTKMSNLKGMSNANIIEKYGKTRGEALVTKKAQNYEKSNEYKKQKEATIARQKAANKEERKLAYAQKMKNIQKKAVAEIAAETLEDMTNEEIIEEYGKVRADVLIKERNKLKKKKLSEEEEYQKELAAEQKRRDEDRAKSKREQEKQRKEFEKEQQRQEEEYQQRMKNFEKREQQSKKDREKQQREEEEYEQRMKNYRKREQHSKKDQEKQQREKEEYEQRMKNYKKREQQKPKTPLTPMTTLKAGTGKFKMTTKITKCSRVLTLEQRNAPTCWFNALMMVLFFSQNTRIAVASSIPYIKDKRKDPLIIKIGKILEGYNKTRANEYLYKRLQPKEFLETIRTLYPKQFPTIKMNGKLSLYQGDSMEYMHRMLQFLEVPHLMLSRPDMKSGKTEWSHYNYDMYENKLFDDDALKKEFGSRKNASTYPKFVDTKRPVILTIMVNRSHDKMLAEMAGKAWIKYTTYPVEGLYTDTHSSKIKYNGETYYLDSMILSGYNPLACSAGHAIAGVTCNNNRFLYNGWTINTVDKGMKKNFQGSKEPCPLDPIDWARTTNFCIAKEGCGYDQFISKLNTKSLCFSTRTNVALTYVRADYVGERIPSIPKSIDKMKQKQLEEGIFDNKRLFDIGVLKRDSRTGKVLKAKGY